MRWYDQVKRDVSQCGGTVEMAADREAWKRLIYEAKNRLRFVAPQQVRATSIKSTQLKVLKAQSIVRRCYSVKEKQRHSTVRILRSLQGTNTAHFRTMPHRPQIREQSEALEQLFEETMLSVDWQTCFQCQRSVLSHRKKRCGKRCSQFSAVNDMDPGPVPDELTGLTYLEQQLIARVHPVVSVYRIKGHQLGYSGNVINFPQAVEEFAAVLPHRITSLSAVIVVRMRNSATDYVDFHVRASKVKKALMWLKQNNRYYFDITISDENMALLPEDGDASAFLPSFFDASEGESENQDALENEVIETSVPSMTTPHQDAQVAAVLDWPPIGSNPIEEFRTPGYITQAFPALFPTGNADLSNPRESKISPTEYFKHLMLFHDHRFANDPRFRFFALNSEMRWSALRSGNLFVRRHEELIGKSIKDLKEMMKRDPSIVKKIMFYANKLRGTRPYWRARLGELLDMEAQLGLPTVFLTLSAADLHWPDISRIFGNVEATDLERRRLVADNPLTPSWFFYERTEFFLDQILSRQLGVKDFWRRYEWQHRGSPHIHMLLWLKDAPDVTRLSQMTEEELNQVVGYFDNLICTMNPGLNTPLAEIHPCRKRLLEVEDRQVDLSELVNKVQRHTRCSTSYCLRKNKRTNQLECRYKFPFDLSDITHVYTNEKGVMELVTKRNDALLNKYNPWTLQLWRANMDITAVMSKDAFLNYMAKYASKSEVKSKTMAEMFENILTKVDDTEPARKAVQKLLVQTCSERDFSSQEVLHLTTGKKLFSASRAFVKLNFGGGEWIPARVHQEPTSEHVDEHVNTSLIEKYIKRPLELENVSLWDVASLFVPKRQGAWTRRRAPAIVSVFPRRKITSDPSLREAFFRQEVLLKVPWRDENVAKGTFQSWEEAYNFLQVQGNPSLDIPIPDDDYEEIPASQEAIPGDEWIAVSKKMPNGGVDQVEPGRREIDVQYNWNASSAIFDDPALLRKHLESCKRLDIEVPEQQSTSIELNAEQRQVLAILDSQISAELHGSPNDAIQLVIIQGKAGCGKSTVIKTMTSRLKETPGLGSASYLLLAPTGSAALNINGNTIHAALSIPVRTSGYRPLEGAAKKRFLEDMDKIRFIIIDEYSMIGLSLFGMIEQRCAESKPQCNSQIFGGIRIYLIGDIRQLPPVASKPLYSPSAKSELEIKGAFAVSQFQHAVVLTQSMRQTDNTFRQALDEVARGRCTVATYAVFSNRFYINLTEEERRNFNDAIHIFSLRMTAKAFNLNRLLGLHSPVARIPAKHNNLVASQGTSDDAGGLQKVIYLAEGALVVLKANLWVASGLVNGAIGEVVAIVYESGKSTPNDLPIAVMVNFANYSGPRMQRDTFPISPIIRSWKKGNATCTREQIPLDLAWACTVHQSQGQTYDRVVVDLGRTEFTIGLSYVALSRCKTLDGLAINPPFIRKRLDDLHHKNSLKAFGAHSWRTL
ncbi:uncharacterized protein LOC128982231 [Macrosteles quadrilineatus]|uniref:uncharacterized protein LOC128982231 n=1 Tax=Macrosteles quadrilineatus TaxID=74068 RepID=UPI0023E21629|nr:uncharacterized protein LOC128982231 [Macrosteles quadrilineatus]